MKINRDVIVAGRPAKLEIEGNRFRFVREDGATLDAAFSCAETSPGVFSVLINGAVHRITLSGLAIEVFDPRDRRASNKAADTHGPKQILASMPGKVVRVLVNAGDEVTEGQGLVVVEAMKMQNEMKSPKAGRVIEVRTKADAAVVAGQVLLVVE